MKLGGFGAGPALARTFTCLLGLAAIAWGGCELPLFWRQTPLDRMASEILQGQTFATPALMDEAKRIEASEKSSSCNPAALNDAAAIRLAIVDNLMAEHDRTLLTSAYGSLNQATRAALSCAPADSFEWLTLFWLDLSGHGFTAKNAVFLRLSYALGPNEGWIALRRNRLAIALFPRLPSDLAEDAVDEFVNLVDTDSLYPETAEIFSSASPVVQQRLAEALSSAKPIPRETFARTIYDNGVNIQIPGVERPSRPWD
jgi:hypothetical protein